MGDVYDAQFSVPGYDSVLSDPVICGPVKKMPQQKPGRSKQDYQTPPEFLRAVRNFLHISDFYRDLAASHENAVVRRYYTAQDNALLQPWDTPQDECNWLNPPFAKIAPWVKKAYESRNVAQTVVLVPAGVGSNWWRDWVDGKARVLLLNGRLTFVGETKPYPKDCCLLVYSSWLLPGYEVWSWRNNV